MLVWMSDEENKILRIALEALTIKILSACSAETGSMGNEWRCENPAYGHCAVIALFVQEAFGGELIRAPLEQMPKYAKMRSHYWNRLPGGIEVDLSASQFEGSDRNAVPSGEVRARKDVLGNPDTANRFELLHQRLDAMLAKIRERQ